MKKLLKYKLILFIQVFAILFIAGCDAPPAPQVCTPKMFADISGEVKLSFSSPVQGIIHYLPGKMQLGLSGVTKKDGRKFGLIISLFFLDSIPKTGSFKCYKTFSGINEDYAIGTFVMDYQKTEQREFYSDSGTVVLTEVSDTNIKGTYEFFASEVNGEGKIYVTNGILDIKW